MSTGDTTKTTPLSSYSLTEARAHLSAIVQDVQTIRAAVLTRRGKPVAVIVSSDEYHRLTTPTASFTSALARFREQFDLAELDLGPGLFLGTRDSNPGPDA